MHYMLESSFLILYMHLPTAHPPTSIQYLQCTNTALKMNYIVSSLAKQINNVMHLSLENKRWTRSNLYQIFFSQVA
jgi:hypothetical protein